SLTKNSTADASMVGSYTRYVVLKDAAGAALCTTSTVTSDIVPAGCVPSCAGKSCGQPNSCNTGPCGDPCDAGCTAHCSNGTKDCDETATDCGGATCGACAPTCSLDFSPMTVQVGQTYTMTVSISSPAAKADLYGTKNNVTDCNPCNIS